MSIHYNTIKNVAVASFETSWKNESANKPIHSIVAEIQFTQDLNGYDYPWPPGGGPEGAPNANICPIIGRTGVTIFNNGSSYPVSWQTEVGTVYGGTVDMISGLLTVDRVGFVIDDNASSPRVSADTFPAYVQSGDRWQIRIGSNTTYAEYAIDRDRLAETVCNQLVYNSGGLSTLRPGQFRLSSVQPDGSTIFQFILPNQPTTIDGLKAVFATNPLQVVYPLATPHTYNLTGQEIRTLLGENNVQADSGNIKKLTWQYSVFDLLQVFINGFEITDLIAFGGWQRERNDVDGPEAGRTLDARMHRARVATKMRYNVTCRPMLAGELASLERLIMPEYVTVKVIGDPYYGTWERTCYVNNTSAKYLIRKKSGEQWWGGVTFPIIEV